MKKDTAPTLYSSNHLRQIAPSLEGEV